MAIWYVSSVTPGELGGTATAPYKGGWSTAAPTLNHVYSNYTLADDDVVLLEAILWPRALTDRERTKVRNNISSYYNITLP